MKLYNGDCLDTMDLLIEQGVRVDAVICDPPYGTTACKWDSVIPFDAMWERLNKLIKPNGAIVLFGSEPFSSALRMSNIKNYKYDWIWDKKKGSNFALAKKQPMRHHEYIHMFYKKQSMYNPQMLKGKPYDKTKHTNRKNTNKITNDKIIKIETKNTGTRYPNTILHFPKKWRQQDQIHPTQKPVALMEYLIKTYTNENELVLDFTMGSGTTGVACKNLNRDFIGIELDKGYYDISVKRIKETQKDLL